MVTGNLSLLTLVSTQSVLKCPTALGKLKVCQLVMRNLVFLTGVLYVGGRKQAMT